MALSLSKTLETSWWLSRSTTRVNLTTSMVRKKITTMFCQMKRNLSSWAWRTSHLWRNFSKRTKRRPFKNSKRSLTKNKKLMRSISSSRISKAMKNLSWRRRTLRRSSSTTRTCSFNVLVAESTDSQSKSQKNKMTSTTQRCKTRLATNSIICRCRSSSQSAIHASPRQSSEIISQWHSRTHLVLKTKSHYHS